MFSNDETPDLRLINEAIAPAFSHDSLTVSFTREHRQNLRYVEEWGQWLTWDSHRWRKEKTTVVYELARTVCRSATLDLDEKEKGLARYLGSAQTRAAVESMARGALPLNIGQLDADPWALNTPGGVVDLRTGELRPNRQEDYFSKSTVVAPDPKCIPTLWYAFLARIFNNDVELVNYVQRWFGYCLTGSVKEHALAFCHGTGGNGKDTLWGTYAAILGDYAQSAATETFMVNKNERHPEEVASLMGARLVIASETREGSRWDESRIKHLTGGGSIRARFMRQNSFDFEPQFKLVIFGNHKPKLWTVDEAIRRRLHFIPFSVTIPEQERDPELRQKLQAEWPGILQWAVEGCLAYQRGMALKKAEAVTTATEVYFAEQDRVADWLNDNCTVGAAYFTSTTALYEDFKRWAESNGERFVYSSREFREKLEARNELKYARDTSGAVRGFRGVALSAELGSA